MTFRPICLSVVALFAAAAWAEPTPLISGDPLSCFTMDGIGLQSHFDSNLTAPSRVLDLLDQFAAFGKDLQVTEFDISMSDEQVQADYTRDFLTLCFSHPAMKGFMMWGFWEGAHWRPLAAMIRRDWSTRPAYDVWNDLIYRQWWTDTSGATSADGIFRTRGFLGAYDVDVTIGNLNQLYFDASANGLKATILASEHFRAS